MIRNIATLVAGNALSQFVNVVTILLVVTAYFSPAEFGRYAVAMSYVGILSSIACFRFEQSIVAVAGERAANNATFASLAIATIFSVALLIVVVAIARILGEDFLLGATPTIVASLIFLKAIDQVGASILYRQEAYVTYSVLKLLQASVLLGGFLWSGVSEAGLHGLLISTMLAYATFAAMAAVVVQRYSVTSGVRPARMLAHLKRHTDFARFNTPQALIDNFLSNGLNFVLVIFAGPAVVGYFSYLHKTLKAPLGLVFGAVSQVVFRFVAKNAADAALVSRKFRQVFCLGSVALLAVAAGVWGVYIFFDELTFLDEWQGLREYLIAFAVWMLVPFLFAPFATLPIIYGRQKQFFYLATSFNLMSLAVLTLMVWQGAVVASFWSVGIVSIAYYLGLNAWLLRIAADGQRT